MSVFEDLGNLITNAQGAVDNFDTKLSSLAPLLGEEDEGVNLDDYIRTIVEQYLSERSETQDSDNSSGSNPKLYVDDIGTYELDNEIKTSQEKEKYHTITDLKGEKFEYGDPFEEIRSDIGLIKGHIASLPTQDVINKLQAHVAALPGKDEIVASVLSRIPAPKCSCQKESGAAAEARDPDCLAGIGPC